MLAIVIGRFDESVNDGSTLRESDFWEAVNLTGDEAACGRSVRRGYCLGIRFLWALRGGEWLVCRGQLGALKGCRHDSRRGWVGEPPRLCSTPPYCLADVADWFA